LSEFRLVALTLVSVAMVRTRTVVLAVIWRLLDVTLLLIVGLVLLKWICCLIGRGSGRSLIVFALHRDLLLDDDRKRSSEGMRNKDECYR